MNMNSADFLYIGQNVFRIDEDWIADGLSTHLTNQSMNYTKRQNLIFRLDLSCLVFWGSGAWSQESITNYRNHVSAFKCVRER